MAGCACGEDWRVEVCDLRTGRVRGVLHPLSMDFQTILNGVGSGTLTLATREVVVRDIWPHLTSVYIQRVVPDGEDVVEFAGLIEQFQADTNGVTSVGLKSIEQYWLHRHLDDGYHATNRNQNRISAELANLAVPNGIPLYGEFTSTQYYRQRNWFPWDKKVIGEAIEELTETEGGNDWELVHTKQGGAWSTTAIFRDSVGSDRALTIKSDREAVAYGLTVDAQNHATHVDGLGGGEEKEMLIATADDDDGIYPRFDAAPAWKDVEKELDTLQDYTDGYLETYQEPFASPDFTIAGMAPDPNQLKLGDTIGIENNFGAVTYVGRARITARGWKLETDNPTMRTFETVPLTRASQAVLNQQPNDDGCGTGDC